MNEPTSFLSRFLELEAAAGYVDREGQELLRQDLTYSDIYDPSALLQKYVSAFDDMCSSQRRLAVRVRMTAVSEAQAIVAHGRSPHEATRRWRELHQWFYGGTDLLGQSVDAAVSARFRANLIRKLLEWFDRSTLLLACLTAFYTEQWIRAYLVPQFNRPDYNPLVAALLVLWLQNLFFGAWATTLKKRCGWYVFTRVRQNLATAYEELTRVIDEWTARGRELVDRAASKPGD